MMIKVFHIDVERMLDKSMVFALCFRPTTNRAVLAEQTFGDWSYDHVATYEAGADMVALELAYAATQNIDRSWSMYPRPGLEPIEPVQFLHEGVPFGRRSTMVGDVLEVGRAEGGEYQPVRRYVVDWTGFRPMRLEAGR